MTSYTSCVQCNCGARYERAEVHLPIKDIGIFECHHCGLVLERWHGKLAPLFRAVAPPQRRTPNAA